MLILGLMPCPYFASGLFMGGSEWLLVRQSNICLCPLDIWTKLLNTSVSNCCPTMPQLKPRKIRAAIADCVDMEGKVLFGDVVDKVSERLDIERDRVSAELLKLEESGFVYLVDVDGGREVRFA